MAGKHEVKPQAKHAASALPVAREAVPQRASHAAPQKRRRGCKRGRALVYAGIALAVAVVAGAGIYLAQRAAGANTGSKPAPEAAVANKPAFEPTNKYRPASKHLTLVPPVVIDAGIYAVAAPEASVSQEYRVMPAGRGVYVLGALDEDALLAVQASDDEEGEGEGEAAEAKESEAAAAILTTVPLYAPGSPADTFATKALWRPEINTDGSITFTGECGYTLRASFARAEEPSTATFAALGVRIKNANTPEDAAVWTDLVPFGMQRASYIVLPAAIDLAAVQLVFVTHGAGMSAQVGASADGPFAPIHSGDTIDLTSGTFAQDEDGAYYVYVQALGVEGAPGSAGTLDASAGAPGEVCELRLLPSQNTMAMYLWSDDPVHKGRAYIESSPDHSLSATGRLALIDTDGAPVYVGGLTQIKGRGNSTWTDDAKKPYQIKLDKKTNLVGSADEEKSKTWVLLAEAEDISNLRNCISLYLGRAIGLEETSKGKFVDLYYDGEYRGIYFLCEKVQVAEGRVDIRDLEGEVEDLNPDIEDFAQDIAYNKYGQIFKYTVGVANPEDITGGYLLEFDKRYRQEASWMATGVGACVVKSPEFASYEQMVYISERMFEACDEASRVGGDMAAYFDVESVARTWLVYAFGRVEDYWRWSSTYFYVDEGGALIHGGPLWDFDNSYGNDTYGFALGFGSASGVFCYRNAQFRAEVQRVYRDELRPVLVQLLYGRDAEGAAGTEDGLVLEELVEAYRVAGENNAMLWGTSGFGYNTRSMDAEYDRLRNWMEQQLAYFDDVVLSEGWV